MPNKPPKISAKKRIVIASIIFAAIAAVLVWLAIFGNSGLKSAVLKTLPLPVALVENQPIYSTQIYERLETAKAAYAKTGYDENRAKNEIFSRLVYEAKLKILAERQKAKLSAWQNFVEITGGESQNNRLLKAVAKSKAEEDAVKFWFYGQKQLNPDAYRTAEFIVESLKQGKDFGELAKAYSQDQASIGLEGDVGPVEAANLLFELKGPLLGASVGENLILPSRLGIHVVQVYLKKISGQGDDVLYLRQIYLRGTDFDSWVKSETKDYKIVNLIKI